MFSRKSVFDEVLAKLALTLELVVLALFFELLISVPAGVISRCDHTPGGTTGLDIRSHRSVDPSFFWILLFLTFGLWLGWLPVQGYAPQRASARICATCSYPPSPWAWREQLS